MPSSACKKKALALGDQVFRRDGKHGRGMAHGAARMRAAAVAHDVGVAEHECDALYRHREYLFFHLPETTLIYTLSLHDALPISSMALCLLLRLFVFRLLRLKRFSTLTLK